MQPEKQAEIGNVVAPETANKVHELISLIEQSLRHDSVGTRLATDTSLALKLVSKIASSDAPQRERIRSLVSLYRAVLQSIELHSSREEHKPKMLWSERPKAQRRTSPFEFVKEQWPTYGAGLSMADIRHHDWKLYNGLYARRSAWPADFVVPTKSETIDELLDGLTPDDKGTDGERKRIERLGSALRRRQSR